MGRTLEIRYLEASVWERPDEAKRARADVYQDILVRGKWIIAG
jgi:hypothetical protein